LKTRQKVEAEMDTIQFSEELLKSIQHTIEAHSNHPKTPDDAIRFWDRITPYAIHPIMVCDDPTK
jgi:hypothetical protein